MKKVEHVSKWLQEHARKVGKYKYTVLILLLGIGLMLLPQGKEQTETSVVAAERGDAAEANLEARLETLLRQVDGAGEVSVLLSLAEGAAYEYQTNDRTKNDDGASEIQKETVIISAGEGETAIATKTRYPVYKGAVVVCQGADHAAVRLDIIKAVSSLTGLSSDKITVIKMKDR